MESRIIMAVNCEGTDATDTKYACSLYPGRVRVTAARIVPHIAVSANDTNYITVSVDGADGSTEIFADRATTVAGGAFAAGTSVALTVTAAGIVQAELDQGDTIKVGVAKAGTGPAYDFDVVFLCEPITK